MRDQIDENTTAEEAIDRLWDQGRDLQERGDIDGGAAIIDRYFDIATAYEEGALSFQERTVPDTASRWRRIGATVATGLIIWGGAEYGPSIIEADNHQFEQRHADEEQQDFLRQE